MDERASRFTPTGRSERTSSGRFGLLELGHLLDGAPRAPGPVLGLPVGYGDAIVFGPLGALRSAYPMTGKRRFHPSAVWLCCMVLVTRREPF